MPIGSKELVFLLGTTNAGYATKSDVSDTIRDWSTVLGDDRENR